MSNGNFSAWEYLKELRQEIVQAQSLRTQLVGFKITLIAGVIGLVLSLGSSLNFNKNNIIVTAFLSLPYFACIFFDFLISGCSIRIDKIGQYIRLELEPKLQQNLEEDKHKYTNFIKLEKWERYIQNKNHNYHQKPGLCFFLRGVYLLFQYLFLTFFGGLNTKHGEKINFQLPFMFSSYFGSFWLTIITFFITVFSSGFFLIYDSLQKLNNLKTVCPVTSWKTFDLYCSKDYYSFLLVLGLIIIIISTLLILINLIYYGNQYYQCHHDPAIYKLDETLNHLEAMYQIILTNKNYNNSNQQEEHKKLIKISEIKSDIKLIKELQELGELLTNPEKKNNRIDKIIRELITSAQENLGSLSQDKEDNFSNSKQKSETQTNQNTEALIKKSLTIVQDIIKSMKKELISKK